MTPAEMVALLPAHEGSLNLAHNEHKSTGQTVEEWLIELDEEGNSDLYDWVSDEQKQKALTTDTLWTLQWYPDDSDSFYAMAAADLDALLTAARAMETGE